MATSMTDSSTMEDSTVCSICFESFKLPRYLPCLHSFCHVCLSSYIVNVCKSTETRLGFNCPLCREYIPSPGSFDRPGEWAELFPVNDVLAMVLEKSEQKRCEACLRDNEEEEASDYCFSCMEHLCRNCTKYHRRGLTTRDHKIYPLKDMKSVNFVEKHENRYTCPQHRGKKIKMYCYDHEQPCCTMCVCTEHRKCGNVDTTEKSAQSLKESGKLGALLNDVKTLEKKLSTAKTEEEMNVTEIDDSVEKITEQTETEFNNLVKHLKRLKNEYLEAISKAGKKSKEKLSSCTERLSDGIQSLNFCCRNAEKALETQNDAELLMKYYIAKEVFQKCKQCHFIQKRISISEKKAPLLNEIKKLEKFSEIEINETEQSIGYDARTVKLFLVKELSMEEKQVRDGIFLSNEMFLLVMYKKDGECLVYDKNGACVNRIKPLNYPFGVFMLGEEVFVTCRDRSTRSIEVFSASTSKKLRSIHVLVDKTLYGITCSKGVFYLACLESIVKVDNLGKILKKYTTEAKSVRNIIATKNEFIVYSNSCTLGSVIAMTDEGKIVWKYSNESLKWPRGLEKDSVDNIYVAGENSHNIHILSGAGELIRVLDIIPRPIFMKISEDQTTCCVCGSFKNIKVFEMK